VHTVVKTPQVCPERTCHRRPKGEHAEKTDTIKRATVPVTRVCYEPSNANTADVWAIGRAVTGTKSHAAGDRR